MNETITMDKAGRLVLPKSIRQKLHLSGSAAFRPQVVGNRVELTLVDESSHAVLKKGGLLVVRRTGQPFDAIKAVAEVRENRK